MAIAQMKHLLMLSPLSDENKLLRAMQKLRCVQIEKNEEAGDTVPAVEGIEQTRDHLKRILWALDKLARFDRDPKPMFNTFPEADAQAVAETEARREELLDMIGRMEEAERRRNEMHAQDAHDQAWLDQYRPWSGLDEPPGKILTAKGPVRFFAGTLPASSLGKLEDELNKLGLSGYEQVGSNRDQACVLVTCHREKEKELPAILDACDFTTESFSPLGDQNIPDFISEIEKNLKERNEERDRLDLYTVTCSENIAQLKILYELESAELRRKESAQRFIVTESTFLLTGWVPAENADRLINRISEISPSTCIELRDPEEDENPPIRLKNNRFASAFEPVVEGYSLPDYRGIDPTAVMAPFYACLFGMMVSDAGYGALMVLALPVFMKIRKIRFENAKMLWLLTWGGVATVIWGLIYNTVFGFNPLPVSILDSVNNSLPVMAVCVGMGAVHLFTGLGVGAYMNFKRHQPMAAFADQIAWATLLIGLGLLILGDPIRKVGIALALASVLIILLFTKRGEKNPLKRITGGLGALYGITSWVSDLLSYMRLFGMGLATGVIGMVFNQLIGMVWDAGVIGKVLGAVLFVGCHGFNLAINALGAYVHSCRLQYIEFFGKFYEEGGKPFEPLDTKAKYVSIPAGENADGCGI